MVSRHYTGLALVTAAGMVASSGAAQDTKPDPAATTTSAPDGASWTGENTIKLGEHTYDFTRRADKPAVIRRDGQAIGIIVDGTTIQPLNPTIPVSDEAKTALADYNKMYAERKAHPGAQPAVSGQPRAEAPNAGAPSATGPLPAQFRGGVSQQSFVAGITALNPGTTISQDTIAFKGHDYSVVMADGIPKGIIEHMAPGQDNFGAVTYNNTTHAFTVAPVAGNGTAIISDPKTWSPAARGVGDRTSGALGAYLQEQPKHLVANTAPSNTSPAAHGRQPMTYLNIGDASWAVRFEQHADGTIAGVGQQPLPDPTTGNYGNIVIEGKRGPNGIDITSVDIANGNGTSVKFTPGKPETLRSTDPNFDKMNATPAAKLKAMNEIVDTIKTGATGALPNPGQEGQVTPQRRPQFKLQP